jgi:hypothetical protein
MLSVCGEKKKSRHTAAFNQDWQNIPLRPVWPRKFAVFRTNASPNDCCESLFWGHRRDLLDHAAVQRLQLLSSSRRGKDFIFYYCLLLFSQFRDDSGRR